MAVEITLNYDQVGALLKSSDVESVVSQAATSIATRCGSGYSCDTKTMGTRVIASVYTDTYEAMEDNAENNTILKNLT